MATVTFEQATRVYPGSDTPAVDDFSLEIKDGEFLVLVGPSGCGKSTSLRMLAGLEEVNSGRIFIGDRDVTDVSPKDRDIAMVFQNYALYPHMTVADNMGFALKIAGEPKDEIRRRVEEAAKILDLEPYLDRKPKALSGGQRSALPWAALLFVSRRCFPYGRAALQPRCQAPCSDPHPDRLSAAPPGYHHRVRDARSDRGSDNGPWHRGSQGRPPSAGRHPGRYVQGPCELLRCRLYRFPRYEPRQVEGFRKHR